MKQKWKTHKLSELTDKIGSGATPRGGKEAYLDDSAISLIRSQNVLDFSFSIDGLAHISDEQAFELRNVTIEEEDVLLNITGDSVARVCKVPKHILPARVNQHVAIVRANKEKLSPDFLKYFLLNPFNKKQLLGLASSGATRNALTKAMIEDFEIIAPNLPTQTRIAAILSALDNKIELNLRMNQTLEAMAQAIYKEWFVKFNFPGAEPNHEYSVNNLPEGWSKKSIDSIITIQNGFAFKSSDFFDTGFNGVIKIKNISGNVIETENVQYISKEVASKLDERFKIKSGDLLIAMTGAEVGKVGFVPNTNKELWLNQRVGSFKEKISGAKLFSYLVLSTPEYQKVLQDSASGSAQPNISASEIQRIETLIPESKKIEQFGLIINPLFEKILENLNQNQTLMRLRDNLLPRLMSGRIEVN